MKTPLPTPPSHPQAPPWPAAAVFDFDGELVDSADCWQNAFAEALTQRGRSLEAELYTALAGASVARAAALLDVPPDDLRTHLADAFLEREPPLMRGAGAVIDRLRNRIPLAIATNAPLELVESTLQHLGLDKSFELISSAETHPHRDKPSPDVYSAACQQLGIDPRNAVAFEDSPIGALAAHRAGLFVVFIPSDGQRTDTADLEVEHLDDPKLHQLLRITTSSLAANDH